MPLRVGLTLSAVCLAALLVSTATASTGAARSATLKFTAPSTGLKIAVPATGHFSITPIAVTTKTGKKPKLHIVGTVAKNLVVAAGLTADPKTKGRFIGLVVLISRKTSSTTKGIRNVETAAEGAPTSVDFYTYDSLDRVVRPPAPIARPEMCNGLAVPIIGGSYFVDRGGVATVAPLFMDASFAVFCPGNFGRFDGEPAGDAFLNDLAGNTAAPTGVTGASGATGNFSFTATDAFIYGAGPSSSNRCDTWMVQETGADVPPTGTFLLMGPGFNMTNPLTFTRTGPGVFSATNTDLLTAFGTYNWTGTFIVSGKSDTVTGSTTLNSTTDVSGAGCPVPP